MASPGHQARRVLGVETEYALAALGSRPLGADILADRLYFSAVSSLDHLPCGSGGSLWLANGGRFYLDAGNHPEYCTPEVDHPIDAVRNVLAGDGLLYQLLEGARLKEMPRQEWVLFKCNVDYSGSRSTWACHENYGHRANPAALPNDLLPHLVSRIIYTGAGGLNPFAPGIQFCLSPRVYHLTCDIGESSTSQRGIFHVKNEPLSGPGWNRLHVLCGDSVFSHRSAVLKLGTTALVVAMAEAALKPGNAVRLQDPLLAMQEFNGDPQCRATVSLAHGGQASALEIQRHYLRLAEAHLEHPCMPPWADRICVLWRATLDSLEQGPHTLMRSLDWPIKLALYKEFLRARGWDDAGIQDHNRRVESELEGTSAHQLVKRAAAYDFWAGLLSDGGESPSKLRARESAKRRLSAPMLEFLKARDALCEMEVRFGQIGPNGLFHRLDQAGQLDHHLPEITQESIRAAMHDPPSRGRAKLRGQFVRAHLGQPGYVCDWSAFQTPLGLIEVPDPCQDHLPEPKPQSEPSLPTARVQSRITEQWLSQAEQWWMQGSYERAYGLLANLHPQRASLDSLHQQRLLLLFARVQCRRGFWQECRYYLQHWTASRPSGGLEVFVEFLAASRLQSLVPAFQEAFHWIAQGERWLAEHPSPDPELIFCFRTHQALTQAHAGRLQAAHEQLQALVQATLDPAIRPRSVARVKAEYSGVLCRLNKWAQAQDLLQQAKSIQSSENLLGDLVEFHLPNAIKCEWHSNPDRALEMCVAGRHAVERCPNPMAMTRLLLLEARLSEDPEAQETCRRLLEASRQDIPALMACPLLAKIFAHWPSWTRRDMIDPDLDYFWGV